MTGPERLPWPPTTAVLMTCHNRRDVTVACLERLQGISGSEHCDVYLTDDGSTDGTAEAIRERFPEVTVVPGDGTLYWSRGSKAAERAARRAGYDAYLYLNDDVVLRPDALERLWNTLGEARTGGLGDAVIVGATWDPDLGATSYGGLRQVGMVPIRFGVVDPMPWPVEVDAFYGNIVLVPQRAMDAVDGLDPVFIHTMGDTDLALRARRAGFRLLLAPGYAGDCEANYAGGLAGARAGLVERVRTKASRKGWPWRQRLVYVRRHGGALWPVLAVSPYVQAAAGRDVPRRYRRAGGPAAPGG